MNIEEMAINAATEIWRAASIDQTTMKPRGTLAGVTVLLYNVINNVIKLQREEEIVNLFENDPVFRRFVNRIALRQVEEMGKS